jgi:phenylpropionate dioxygenase-like ring-hydroxylating dioxygenase large terminal subunit
MILVRGDDKVIRVLLNTCTHRGALICRQKSGNALQRASLELPDVFAWLTDR